MSTQRPADPKQIVTHQLISSGFPRRTIVVENAYDLYAPHATLYLRDAAETLSTALHFARVANPSFAVSERFRCLRESITKVAIQVPSVVVNLLTDASPVELLRLRPEAVQRPGGASLSLPRCPVHGHGLEGLSVGVEPIAYLYLGEIRFQTRSSDRWDISLSLRSTPNATIVDFADTWEMDFCHVCRHRIPPVAPTHLSLDGWFCAPGPFRL